MSAPGARCPGCGGTRDVRCFITLNPGSGVSCNHPFHRESAPVELSTVLAWVSAKLTGFENEGHEFVAGRGDVNAGEEPVIVFLPGGNFPESDGGGVDLEAALVDAYRRAEREGKL